MEDSSNQVQFVQNSHEPIVNFTHKDEEHIAKTILKMQGPVKWCKRCSRKHPVHVGCNLVEVENDNIVKKLVHPEIDHAAIS